MTNATVGAGQLGAQANWVFRRVLGLALLMVLGGGGTACSLEGLLNSDKLPPDVSDPAFTQNPEGARAAYHGTLAQFRLAFGGRGNGSGNNQTPTENNFVGETGILSDELLGVNSSVDRRTMPDGSDAAAATYSSLQKVRGQAGHAIGLLTRYLPEQPALVGHLYAIQGYAELFLAELFCSGIPLGTLDFDGDFTYRPGSSTEDVLSHAVALFDTALTLAGDSLRFVDLARVGRGRALLGRGRVGDYAQAAATVAAVSNGYRYDVSYNNVTSAIESALNFAYVVETQDQAQSQWPFTVLDREGFNGLDWRTSGDPRTRSSFLGPFAVNNGLGHFVIPIYHPDQYSASGTSPIVLASGVEARLIEAEAALQAGDAATWRATLNALRTDGTFDTQPNADDPSKTDTLWHAGSGGVAGLDTLADPGTPTGRVDLLFRERGFWLFLTGHRQGDLRRLIRQYGPRYPQYTQNLVYPVGPYPLGLSYGADVTAPVPSTEFVNPLYTGCVSRGA